MGILLKLLSACFFLLFGGAFRGTLHHHSIGLNWFKHRYGLGAPSLCSSSRLFPLKSSLHLSSSRFNFRQYMVEEIALTDTNITSVNTTSNITSFNSAGYEVGQRIKCTKLLEAYVFFVAKCGGDEFFISKGTVTDSEEYFYLHNRARRKRSMEEFDIEIIEIDAENKKINAKYISPVRVGKRKFEELENWGVNQCFNGTVVSINSTGLLVEMDDFDAQGIVPAGILPKGRPIEEQYPVNSSIRVMFEYLNIAKRKIVFDLFEGRSEEEQANLARLPYDKWMQAIIVEVRSNQLRVRPVASGVTEMIYINQIPLELVETLMTRMSLDSKNDHLLFNHSISNLEVVFNVGDVIETRVIKVKEFPEDYLALTMIQKDPPQIPNLEEMHIYDEVTDVDIVGTDMYQPEEENIVNPERWEDDQQPSETYSDYIESMKRIARIRTKPTIINEKGQRKLHPIYDTAKLPRDFQLGPKFNLSSDKRIYYEKLKKMAMKGFNIAYPTYNATEEEEQLARDSYTWDFSDENRLDFGNQEELSDPDEGRYIDYEDWEFENCLLWWRGKPYKKTSLFLEEEMERELYNHPDQLIYYESPKIRQGAWARYIRSMEVPDSDEGSNREMEIAMREIDKEIGELSTVQEDLGEDAVGYGIPDLNTNRMYHFLDRESFPEELREHMTFYDKEEANRQAMQKVLRQPLSKYHENFQTMVNKLIKEADEETRAEEAEKRKRRSSDLEEEEEEDYYGSKNTPKKKKKSYDEDEEEEDYRNDDNDLDGTDDVDNTFFPFDSKLPYWLTHSLQTDLKALRSKSRHKKANATPDGQGTTAASGTTTTTAAAAKPGSKDAKKGGKAAKPAPASGKSAKPAPAKGKK